MREVGVLEAKTNLSSLLEQVENGGEEIVITRNGRPVARLLAAGSAETPPVQRRNGAEIVARLEKLRAAMIEEHPAIQNITWEELKQMARE
ncbi:type II toxin-antitoxin system Phd/YefM family antitoxin [Phenylobacterium sp.]|uniref:type II toxin-antitoxin system Phd/YefM family antitoxin n=1 Tax=Phenylobacterium sp. TaxID=1871053 RepID=UPI00286B2E5D|nr:type II toxin-antitoxin system Phd/YefM family antitoxin [Phenylobacterium sp.]